MNDWCDCGKRSTRRTKLDPRLTLYECELCFHTRDVRTQDTKLACPTRPWKTGPGAILVVCRHDCACAQEFVARQREYVANRERWMLDEERGE